jgi:prepilin-type N-terminal cleavage/methylation domain-containing protein
MNPIWAEGEKMKKRLHHSGFTMIEIIAVLVITAIIAAVAVTRISSNDNNLIAVSDTLRSHLRLAQAKAMSSSTDTGIVWGVRFISSTQYHLFYCATASTCDPTNAANQSAFPGAGSIIMDLSDKGVQVVNGAGILAFNRFGTPYINATLTTILANQLTLTLQDNNGGTITINITPQTGMIAS